MIAFATVDQLASTLGVATPTDPLIIAQWQSALEDASGYLREVIGQPIYTSTVTLSLTTDAWGEVDIWPSPLRSITSIVDPDGNTLTADDYAVQDQRLYLRRPNTTYTVTLTFGYATVPSEIVRWTKVLANAQIQAAAQGMLGISGVSSVAIDDGKVTYNGGMVVALPPATAQWLKATFGGPQ